jgi:hypothetical protein
MWGTSIVGFGSYDYVYESGRSGSWMICGFSPRKQNLTIYIMSGFTGYPDLMNRLGKYKTGKSCLYIKSLADVDRRILAELINESVKYRARNTIPPIAQGRLGRNSGRAGIRATGRMSAARHSAQGLDGECDE